MADAAPGRTEDFGIVVAFEAREVGFRHAGGHEFRPRSVVNQINEVVYREFDGFVVQIGAIDEQRHADGDAAQDGNGVFSLLFPFVFQRLLGFGLGIGLLGGLLVGRGGRLGVVTVEPVVADFYFIDRFEGLGGADLGAQAVEVGDIGVFQAEQLIII